MLWTSGLCRNSNDHHDIKQKYRFILPLLMPKIGSCPWKMIPSLYPNQRLKHVKNEVHHWDYSWFNFVRLVFEKFFEQLRFSDAIVTLGPHLICYNIGWVLDLHAFCKFECIQACIQDGYFIHHNYVISKQLQYPTLTFTIFTWLFSLYFYIWSI